MVLLRGLPCTPLLRCWRFAGAIVWVADSAANESIDGENNSHGHYDPGGDGRHGRESISLKGLSSSAN